MLTKENLPKLKANTTVNTLVKTLYQQMSRSRYKSRRRHSFQSKFKAKSPKRLQGGQPGKRAVQVLASASRRLITEAAAISESVALDLLGRSFKRSASRGEITGPFSFRPSPLLAPAPTPLSPARASPFQASPRTTPFGTSPAMFRPISAPTESPGGSPAMIQRPVAVFGTTEVPSACIRLEEDFPGTYISYTNPVTRRIDTFRAVEYLKSRG